MFEVKLGANSARSRFESETFKVDETKFPAATVEFLVRFAVKQKLDNATIGAASQDEYRQQAADMLQRLYDGDLARRKGERDGLTDDPTTLAKQLARAEWTAKIKAAAKARYDAMSKEERTAAFEKSAFGPDGIKFPDYVAIATKQIAERKAAAEDVDLDALGI